MPGKKATSLFLLLTALALSRAQSPRDHLEQAEELLYQESTAGQQEELEFILHKDQPLILLNQASQSELEASGFLTSYQAHELIRYREKYGPLFSIYELLVIPGFHEVLLEDSRVFSTTVKSRPVKKPSRRQMFMAELKASIPESGKNELGSPQSLCIRSHFAPLPHLNCGFLYEKDPGEELLCEKQPQHLSGFIALQGSGILHQLCLGNYRLHQGCGLIHGTGLFHSPQSMYRSAQTMSRLLPSASRSENHVERGAALALTHHKSLILFWSSFLWMDLSLTALEKEPTLDSWWLKEKLGGLYRTNNELECRKLAQRFRSGAQYLYDSRHFSLGISLQHELRTLSKKGRDLLSGDAPRKRSWHSSIHSCWKNQNWRLFGEWAIDPCFQMAFLAGGRFVLNDYLRLHLLMHHYAPEFQEDMGLSYGSGSHIRNEQGLALSLELEPGSFFRISASLEAFRYPLKRHLCRYPSESLRWKLVLQSPGENPINWRCTLSQQTREESPHETTQAVRPLDHKRLKRIDFILQNRNTSFLHWNFRFLLNQLDQSQGKHMGFAALQDLRLKPCSSFSLRMQFVLFQIPDWDMRLYLHEPGLYASFNFPVYYGAGQKMSFLFLMDLGKALKVSGKISRIQYFTGASTAADASHSDSPLKWELAMQLRALF